MRPFDFYGSVRYLFRAAFGDGTSEMVRRSAHTSIANLEQFPSWAREPPAFVIGGFITAARSSIFRRKAAINNHMNFALLA
jgi:hypothetical protein